MILPKKKKINGEESYYLSYSQISSFLKYKKDYYSSYFYGTPFTGNAYTEFGLKIGEALEGNDFKSFTTDEKEFLSTITRYDEFEREINLKLPNGVFVTGYIDTNTSCLKKIADYKTGTESKISEYDDPKKYLQLPLYAAAIEQEVGNIPEECKVVLIGRAGNAFANEDLTLTKEKWEIPLQVGREEIDNAIKVATEVSEQIGRQYSLYLKLNS